MIFENWKWDKELFNLSLFTLLKNDYANDEIKNKS